MAIIVQKYGGKSVATPELMRDIAKRILRMKKKEDQIAKKPFTERRARLELFQAAERGGLRWT